MNQNIFATYPSERQAIRDRCVIAQEELRALLRKIHVYWVECEVAELDESRYALETDSRGKGGAVYEAEVANAVTTR